MDDHTLADEIQSYAIDVSRIFHIVDSALDILVRLDVHHALRPSNIIIGPTDNVAVRAGVASREAPYAAPETIHDGTLTRRSNVYSIGVILRELHAERPDIPQVGALIRACTDPEPSNRPESLDAVREELSHFPWHMSFRKHGPWIKPFAMRDAREVELVNALRADPDDQATRMVYADWLLEHGLSEDACRRALTSRAAITRCWERECPKTWDGLRPTALDNIRKCQECSQAVHYCATLEEAEPYGAREERVVFDVGLENGPDAYHRAIIPRMPGNPPPPGYFARPDQGSVLARFFGWFRR